MKRPLMGHDTLQDINSKKEQSMDNIVRYEHHGNMVYVDEEYQGKHRDMCLCYRCEKFTPGDRGKNCPIANVVFANCVAHGIVTPVLECPNFVLVE